MTKMNKLNIRLVPPTVMRISCSLGSMLSIDEVIRCSEIISKTRTEAIWVPETWGMENFAMLGAISGRTVLQKLGSSIINIYSRSPTTIAMVAATVDTLSGGRLILGLGTSSVPIVESFHGYKFERPLQRIKEYVDIIRLVLSEKRVDYSGEIFCLKGFSLLTRPVRQSIPIYMAVVNREMVKMAWNIADGVIFYLRPLGELRQTISEMQSKKEIDITCQIITCVGSNAEAAVSRAKKTLAFYIAVGQIYRKFLAENGYKNETSNIFEEFKRSGLESCHEMVPDSMLKELCIAGTGDECRNQLDRFRDAGVGLPILQFNPVGDVTESFDLLKRAFLED